MTKESHLAHIIIASSDGYFLDTVYTDSKLKKTSVFYKVDYLSKEDCPAFGALGPVAMLKAFAKSVGRSFVKGHALGDRLCPERP